MNRKLTVKVISPYFPVDSRRLTARHCFPDINVDQNTGIVTVSPAASGYTSAKYPSRAHVDASAPEISISVDRQAAFVRGKVNVKNYKRWKNSGEQAYCFAVFVGDSGHIYVHRAPATNGWMKAKPSSIISRLRKLGDHRAQREGTLQQGDILLIPVRVADEEVKIGEQTIVAKADALDASAFAHETTGIGHHRFSVPVLFSDVHEDGARRILVNEEITLTHQPASGAVHPQIVVKPGQYLISGTARSLGGRQRSID